MVRIASAAAAQSSPRAWARSGRCRATRSSGSGWPITPVEATNTSSQSQPTCFAAATTVAATVFTPAWPVKALALPALTTTARARPWGSARRHQSTGAEGQRERV